MPSSKSTRRGDPAAYTQKYLKRREAIIGTSARLFNRDGLKGATLAEIAGDVGLLTHSITYYYRRKEDLAAACLLTALETTRNVVLDATRQSRPEDRIRSYVCGYADLLAEIATGTRDELVFFNDIRALTGSHARRVFDAYNDLFRSVRSLLPAGGSAEDRPSRNARAHLLLSLVNMMRAWISRYEPSDYRPAAERMSAILIDGLARSPKSWREAGAPELGWPRTAAARDVVPEAFLRAATMMVNEQGYRGASLDRIASSLNLTKGSFYHHYASKDELIIACFERTFDVVRRMQSLAIERSPSGWARLCMSARELVRFQLSDQGPLLRITAWGALPIGQRKDAQAGLNRLTERFGRFIVEAMQQGEVRVLDASIAAQLVSTMVNAASELERWAPGLTAENAVRLYVRPLFAGLLSTESSTRANSAPRTRA